jgi:hypothetical protein
MLSFALAYWGQNFFVRFLGELKKPKSPFKINCPLPTVIGFGMWVAGDFCQY